MFYQMMEKYSSSVWPIFSEESRISIKEGQDVNWVADIIWVVFVRLAYVEYISYVSLHSFMSSELSVKEFSFISYFSFSHNSCDRCAIPYDDVDEDKVSLKVEDGEDKKYENNDNLEVLDEDVDR